MNALVKEVQSAVSSVLLIMPIASLSFLRRDGGTANHSPDCNTVGIVPKSLSLVTLG